MYSIQAQTAIINSIVGNALLAAIFFYLWRVDRRESALGCWAAAYAASAGRVAFRLAGLEGFTAAIYGEAVFGSLAVVLLWMGTRLFVGRSFRSAWKEGLGAMAGMGGVTALAVADAIPIVVPYLIAGAVLFLAGLALLRRGRESPGIGYGIVGFLFAVYGGYVFVFSQLAATPDNPRAYLFGPIVNLAIGMVLLVVTQRKHQFEAEKLNRALLREAAGRQAAEEVGIQSEQRYRAIVDTTRSLIGLLTPEGTVIDVNRATLERAGVAREKVIGKPLWEAPWWIHDPEQQQRLKQAVRRVAAGGHDRFESSHPSADGSVGYYNFFLTPIRDAAGQVIYLVPEGHDITGLKRSEQNLHAAELRFRAICEGSMLGVLVTGAEGEIVYFSRRATEITGLTESEALEGKMAERLHPDDVSLHKSQWLTAIQERRPFVGERRYIRRDGSIAWCRVHAAPILEGARLHGFVATVEDVNARKQSEQALRESEERFSSFFALSPEPAAVAQFPNGEYVKVNEAWEKTFGYRQDEVVGRTGLELGLWERPDERREIYTELQRRNQARSGEIRLRRKDGSVLTALISARVVAVGQTRYILWGTHDVTERRRMEEALRESEEKFSKFFALGPEPMAVVRYEDAAYIDVNEAWLRKFGFRREEVVGHTPQELDLWEDFGQRRRVIEILDKEGQVDGLEACYKAKDGTRILADISAKMFDLAGTRCVLWDVHDITEKRNAEMRLRISEEKFSKAFHSSPDYMTISRLSDGVVLDCNEAFERTTGYRRDEALGRSTLDLGIWRLPEERARFTSILARQGWLRDFECTLYSRDGRELASRLTASTIEINGEQCAIGVVRDVGAQRRMEQELRASEEMFSTIFHQLPVAIAVTTREEGRYLDINQAWLDQFGYRREEVVGRTGRELDFWVDQEDRAALADHLSRNPDFLRREIPFRAKDGRTILTECSGRVFRVGEEDVVIWSAPDITERKRIEQALREGEEKFSAIFHRSPVALGLTSIPDGRYLDVNETWERQFRYPRERMIGRTSLEIGLWLNSDERRRLFDDLGVEPQVKNREVHFHRGDGAELLCELSGQVFELNGRKVLLWGAHDVSEHRRVQREIEELNLKLEARVQERTAKLERANAELGDALESLKLAQNELVRAEKLAALGSLVAGVAHELNTPIGNSVTVASTLLDKTQEFDRAVADGRLKRSVLEGYREDARTACELLLRSLSQANDLVSSFKQVAVDQASAQRRRFDLRLVVEEVSVTLAPMLKKTPFKLELDLADNVVMDSYPGSIGQVITNLVTNSLAHAFEGREQGLMQIKTWRRGLHMVEMTFTDDGAGISESDMKRVFDPFFTTRLGRGGSGLGLHIVYNLVTRVLGGRIQASSQLGVGTRFHVSLPMKAPDKAERDS